MNRSEEGSTLTEALIALVVFALIGMLLNRLISDRIMPSPTIEASASYNGPASESGYEPMMSTFIELYRLNTLLGRIGNRIQVPFFAVEYIELDPGRPGSASVRFLDGDPDSRVAIASNGQGTVVAVDPGLVEYFPALKEGWMERINDPAGVCTGLALEYRLPGLGAVEVRLMCAGIPIPSDR